ncbi:MAG: efflux RND transporter periplasmic adaptor subunit [Patescibacteria group bacterium]|jgi:multidrug efflux pump subunit AcrA (membrane-fusion protein)
MRRFYKILLSKKWLLIIVPAVLIAGWFMFFNKEKPPEYTLAKVEKGTIKQTVSETGIVESNDDLSLAFPLSGRLEKIYFKEGEKVAAGEAIAELDYGGLTIKEKEAGAGVMAASANLQKLLSGSTGEEIKVARANVAQAEAALTAAEAELVKTKNTAAENERQAEKNLSDLESGTPDNITTYEQAITQASAALKTAQTTYLAALETAKTNALATTDEVILDSRTALDKVNAILEDDDADTLFSVRDPQFLTNTKNGYASASGKIPGVEASIAAARTDRSDDKVKEAAADGQDLLNSVLYALENCFQGLEKSLTSSSFTQAELDAYKTSISAQIGIISADIQSLDSAEQTLDTAISNYDLKIREAEESLNLSQASFDNALQSAKNSSLSAKLTGEQQITAGESKVSAAEKSLDSAKASLDKILSGSNDFDIRAAEANLNQAEAGLESIRKQIEDSIIKAPIAGTVTRINFDIGETVTANSPAISILGENNFNARVDISEIDVSKISLGNECEITFDAFGTENKFMGRVYFIDTAPTIIQDVVYYKVKVSILPNGENNGEEAVIEGQEAMVHESLLGVKSGMTANIDIFAAKKDDVLIMPQRAIVDKNGLGKFVRVLENNELKEIPVEIGLKGDEGMVEVISGVKEGDEVVTFVKENK